MPKRSLSLARRAFLVPALLGAAVLVACGGGDHDDASTGAGLEKKGIYSVGGTISGLGEGVNDGNTLNISVDGVRASNAFTTNGNFTLTQLLEKKEMYNLSISPPEGYNCFGINTTGTINKSNVTNVVVTCERIVVQTFPVRVNVQGLPAGNTLVMGSFLPAPQQLTISADGTYTFPIQITGFLFNVDVVTQPAAARCVADPVIGVLSLHACPAGRSRSIQVLPWP
jgi:trimeric autotransporter adhesin